MTRQYKAPTLPNWFLFASLGSDSLGISLAQKCCITASRYEGPSHGCREAEKGRTDSATFRHCGKCAKKDKYLKNAAMERRQMELGISRENILFTK